MSAIPGMVAINTFREAVRDRVLYNLIFFALMMIGAAVLVGQISIGIERMVIIDLGLSAISVFGIMMAIFIGVGLVYKEMEKRTLYSLLAKPIRRWEFLVGKFAGLLLTLVVNTSLMTLGLGVALCFVGGKFQRSDATILVAVSFILLELALVTALALFFSCFTSPMLSTLYTLGIYVAGVFAPGILGLSQFTQNWELGAITRFIYYVLPNFHDFGVIAVAAHGDAVPLGLIWHNTLYAALYVVLILVAASAVFSGRVPEMSRRSQNKSHTRAMLLALLAVPALFVVCAALQVRIDAETRWMNQDKEELVLRSGWLLKNLSLGYEPLLADIYWTRVVQYYGVRARKPGATYESLWPLLDITTTLDPKLMIAYRFGAVFLSEQPPVGPGRADLAVELVKRGIAENPDEWRLYQDLGFLYSIHLKDYQKAADAYLEGSKNPHAQIWMKVMAARVAETGNALETSKLIWIEVYASTKDELVRRRATQHIHALDAALGLKRLNESSEDYWRKFGRFPASMQELRAAGLVGGALQDPDGFPYVMGANGVPQLNPKSTIVLDMDQGPEKLR